MLSHLKSRHSESNEESSLLVPQTALAISIKYAAQIDARFILLGLK